MKDKQSYKYMVFCDFDGTITVEETFVGMLKQFSTADYARTEQLLVQGKISLRDAVRKQVESIPSERYPQVLDFIRDKAFRDGFAELLDFLYFNGVPFVVVSGGLLDSVRTKLADYAHRIHAMHAATVRRDGKYLKVFSDYESDTELVAKTAVMTHYRFDTGIVIGDGITDLNPALAADLVFARAGLRRYLANRGKTSIVWENFYDIINNLQKRWLVDPTSTF
jgi:2-hydroxy-3-keto-5-methylthiopentenyl-1-phosphate phosphatase